MNRLPLHKLLPANNKFVTAFHILKKKLNIDENCVNLLHESVEIIETAERSSSYPGLLTLYRHHVISGEVVFPGDDLGSMTPSVSVVPPSSDARMLAQSQGNSILAM